MSVPHLVWWITLIVTLVVFVPMAVYWLHRTWRAARSIQRYAADTLVAAAGIATGTENIAALQTTSDVAGEILQAARDVDGKLATIADVLTERAG
jgi:Ca2+/H+ antiporter